MHYIRNVIINIDQVEFYPKEAVANSVLRKTNSTAIYPDDNFIERWPKFFKINSNGIGDVIEITFSDCLIKCTLLNK